MGHFLRWVQRRKRSLEEIRILSRGEYGAWSGKSRRKPSEVNSPGPDACPGVAGPGGSESG